MQREEVEHEGAVLVRVTIYSGTGKKSEPEPLSAIIERINSAYGTNWTDADRLVFDAAVADLVADETVQVTAANNTPENFNVVFPEMFQKALLGRIDRNAEVV